MSNHNLLTVEHDYRTPMLKRLFMYQESYRNKNQIPLASKRWPFEKNPKWKRCCGGWR